MSSTQYLGDAQLYVGYAFTRHPEFFLRLKEFKPVMLQLQSAIAKLAGTVGALCSDDSLGAAYAPHRDARTYLEDADKNIRLFRDQIPKNQRSEPFKAALLEYERLMQAARGLLLA